MKKKDAAWKGVLLFAAAFALPLCLGAGPAGQKGPVGEGEGEVGALCVGGLGPFSGHEFLGHFVGHFHQLIH